MNLKRSENTSGTSERKLWTGFANLRACSVNPTKEELSELLNYDLQDDAEDLKYSGQDKNGDEYVDIVFWLQADTAEGQWFKKKFRITDKVVVSEKSGSTQYVNQTGGSSYVQQEENLLEWFKKFQDKEKNNIADKIVRPALQGEANLYNFLRALLSKVDWFDPETNILIDKARMFRNIDKYVQDEYLPLLKAEGDESLVGPVVALATVYTGEKDGEIKHYQNLHNEFLPGYQMKKISLAASTNNWTADKTIKRFVEQATGEFGIKDAYTIGLLTEFDPNNHIQATSVPFDAGDINDTSY